MNIDQLAADIGSRMVEVVDASVRLFVDTEDFEYLFESIFNRYVGDGLQEWQYEAVYNEVFGNAEVLTALSVIKELIREYLEDNAPVLITESDRLKYYGLVASDFVG